jgi:hypothetical protein
MKNQQKNKDTIKERLYSKIKVNPKNNCWEIKLNKGARYPWIRVNGKYKRTHRVSYEIHIGKIPDGINCLHKCDNTKCCNPEHLFLGTQADNVADMIKKGRKRIFKGIELYEAKLNKTKILAIKKKIEKGIPVLKVAKQYGVNQVVIRGIASGRGWKHLNISIKIPLHKRFKLTEKKVKEILSLLKKGYSCDAISKKYNVCWNSIYRIKTGEGWKNVKR